MHIPKLQIGNVTAKIPIVQGGMGVRVSLSSLASAVANEGGVGTISSIGLGDIEASKLEYERMSREALVEEIRKAKSMTTGNLAVNFMGVLSNVVDLIKAAVKEGIKIIVFGAGLPVKLPAIVDDSSVNLIPIVSSARVAELILRSWDKRYQKIPEAFILEGPLAGGGIFTGEDIAQMLALGASGVQMATRFVCTEECGVSQEFKQSYLNAKKDDIIIIKSPVGMPGRAINNIFLKNLEIKGRIKIDCPYKCLSVCKVAEARYCIARALLNAYFGDVDHGLIFCGANAYRINEIVTVKELIAELVAEIKAI